MKAHDMLAIGAALTLWGCAATQQPAGQTALVAKADCAGLSDDATVATLYRPGNIAKIEPTYRQEFHARAIQPVYVSGARLYVPAERGMTDVYLERVLSCHVTSAASAQPNDPLRAGRIADVDVDERGPMMRIEITGTDRSAGKAIWERAQALYQQRGDVSVEQLSSLSQRQQF